MSFGRIFPRSPPIYPTTPKMGQISRIPRDVLRPDNCEVFMQRPIMNPIFPDASKSKVKLEVPLWKRILNLPDTLIKLLLADIFFWRSNRLRIEEGSVIGRVFQATLYRLLFVPLFAVLVVLAMVYLPTHPPHPTTVADPQSLGIYYDKAEFKSADGSTDLEGWLVPILDAQT